MGLKLETLGNGMALLCAVHCVALPLVVGASCCVRETPWGGPWVEAGMLGTTGLIGYTTLGLAFRRHGRWLPLVLLTAGLGLMLAAQKLLTGGVSTAGIVAGSLIVVGAQVLNRKCPAPCCADTGCATDERAPLTARSADCG